MTVHNGGEDRQNVMRTNESKATRKRPTAATRRTDRVSASATPRISARRTPREAPIAGPGDDEIRLRAYELYLERGGQHGDPGEDWLRAERELIERRV